MAPTYDVVRHETIELRGFVSGLMADFQMAAHSRHVVLDALVFADEIKADASLLRRLLTGLLGGALRRAPAGTNISLVVSPSGRYTEFRVADEGAGVVETREAVFDNGAGSMLADGSGLTFCRSAAEANGGGLSVVEMDLGTVVCLSLPSDVDARAQVPRDSGVHVRFDESAATKVPPTVLVVDDEPLIRTLVQRDLSDSGYVVVEADSAEQALEILRTNRRSIALLLSDVGLPGASGAELVRQARLLAPELPALLMSADSKAALTRDGLIKQETFLLQKPFAIPELLGKLAELLAPRRTRSRALGAR
jgi:CheY-like chemotaxis protein